MKERQTRAETRGQLPTTVMQRHNSVGSVSSAHYRQISSQVCCTECQCAVPSEERLLSPGVSTKSLIVSLLLPVTAGHVSPRRLEGFPLGFGWFRDH